MVLPAQWPPKSGVRPIVTEGEVHPGNLINLRTGAGGVTIWLSPEVVDFKDPITLVINGKRRDETVAPDVEVLLEDVRRRADRIHPFWAKVKLRTGRG